MFFLPLFFIVLEVMAFTTFTHFYPFWDVFFFYVAPSLLGFIIFSMLGRRMVAVLQGGLQPGQLPSDRILHGAAMLVGSVLLLVPLFTPRVLAVLLLVPGLRHFSVFVFKTYIFQKISKNAFSFVRYAGQGPRQSPRHERDAEVVNVTPIEVTHTKINSTEKK